MNPPINTIICGDSVEVMKQMESDSIDLIVTSPPYNLRQSSGNCFKTKVPLKKWKTAAIKNGYENHDDKMPHDLYVKWQRDCLTQMFRLIKDDGAIFYNHKWRVQNGLMQDRQDIVGGFPVRQIIIWQRSGGINFNDGYFVPTFEVIYLICKPKFRLLKKANSIGDVWRIKPERKNEHPAPFPIELPETIIKSTAAKVILDPFMGSGTTALAALKLNRGFIGIDNSPAYCDMATKRVNAVLEERRNPRQPELPL